MPFITSLGRRACNVCRKVTPKGGTVYQGEHTGMVWCESCASTTLGRTHDPRLTETTNTTGRVTLPASWGRFKPAAVPVYGERED